MYGIIFGVHVGEEYGYNEIKRLSDEDLEALWVQYFENKTNKKLRDALIVQYIYLTRYVIGRIKLTLPPSFSIEDIASYGVEGLIDSIEKYTPDKGTKFETYALIRIRGNIMDKVRSQNWIPRSQRKKIKDVKEAIEKLKQQYGRVPTSKEIAKLLNIEPEKVDEILADDPLVISIYEKNGQIDDSNELIDTICDEKHVNPLEQLSQKDTQKELQDALQKLPERERMIMALYYHENMTLKDIGDMINVTESRVCQLHAQAIMKLRLILTSERKKRMMKRYRHYFTKSK